jgi:UDP-glucose 4-epimerase
VVSLFSKAILERRRPTIYGDGEQSRDFIFADDIAALCDLAARSRAGVGKVYNGGRGERVTLNQIWALLQKIEGIDLPAEHGPWREGDVRHSQADISAARRDLGFEPKVSLEDGLRRTLEWTRGVRGS